MHIPNISLYFSFSVSIIRCRSKHKTDAILTEGVNYAEIDAKDPETLTEEEKIALLGRPRLGDITKIQIRIRESKEFKVMIIILYERTHI